MKIRIRSHEANLNLWLPTNLIFSKPVALLGGTVGKKYAGDAMKNLSAKDLDRLFAEFRRIKRTHGTWNLVEIESADGDSVHIIL